MAKEKHEKRSIGEKIEALEQAAAWFQGEEFNLDEAEEKYKQLAKLAKEVDQDLAELKNKIEVVEASFSV